MSILVVTDAVKKETYTGQYGDMQSYEVIGDLDGEPATVELSRKIDSQPPHGTLEGTIQAPSRPGGLRKLVKFKPVDGGGGYSGGGGGGGFTPAKQAEIRRQAAQKCAVWLLQAEVNAGLKFDHEPASALLKPRIDFFDRDAQEAGERAS